jgi:hypothetical protein
MPTAIKKKFRKPIAPVGLRKLDFRTEARSVKLMCAPGAQVVYRGKNALLQKSIAEAGYFAQPDDRNRTDTVEKVGFL